jgi:hypothetical protein
MEAMTIVIYRHVTLNEIVQFALEMDRTIGLIVCEQITKMDPDLASSRTFKA